MVKGKKIRVGFKGIWGAFGGGLSPLAPPLDPPLQTFYLFTPLFLNESLISIKSGSFRLNGRLMKTNATKIVSTELETLHGSTYPHL